MKTEQLIRLGITDTVAKEILKMIELEQNKVIPKQRFDQVNERKKELERQILLQSKQLEELNHIRVKNLELEKLVKDFWEIFCIVKRIL